MAITVINRILPLTAGEDVMRERDRLVIYSGLRGQVEQRYCTERYGETFNMGDVLGQFGQWKNITLETHPNGDGVCYVSRETLTPSGEWITANPNSDIAYRENANCPLLYMET